MEILTNRPKNMSFEDYKAHMRNQSKWIKQRLKPLVYYVSWITRQNEKGEFLGFATSQPFVGSVKYDLKKPM